jgi:hypothetical protein
MDTIITSSSLDINIIQSHEVRSVPKLVSEVHDQDNGNSHEIQENVLHNVVCGLVLLVINRIDSYPDLAQQDKDISSQSEPGAVCAGS